MIDDLATWKSTFEALPKVTDISWAANFANWVYDRVVNNELTGLTTASPPLLFDKGTFQTALEATVQTTDPVTGATQFANAWLTAINASTILQVVPGDSVGAATPATTWSVVSTALLNPAGIAAGYSILLSLSAAVPSELFSLSEFPEKFRLAFLALLGDVSGLDSVPPPAGPNALVVSLVPLI